MINNAPMKITMGGKKQAIDIRGNGGLAFAPPTCYQKRDTVVSYEWLHEFVSGADTPAMPTWLIHAVNGDEGKKRKGADGKATEKNTFVLSADSPWLKGLTFFTAGPSPVG